MNDLQNYNIVFTFFSLWLAVYLSASLEGYIAYFFILSIGLLHGANDLKIIRKVYQNRNWKFYKVLSVYISIVLLGTLIFYFIPSIALIFFIVISGYHFGEQHFHNININHPILRIALFGGYGCVVLFLLLLSNSEESSRIIYQITNIHIYAMLFKYSLLSSIMVFGISFIIVYRKIKEPIREIFNLLVFFIVFKTASLIWGFAIYFIIWHSLPSLFDQIKYLSGKVNKTSISTYLKSSFLYWVISVIGLFLFIDFFITEENLLYASFFSFLAAITFPHVLVMTKILKH